MTIIEDIERSCFPDFQDLTRRPSFPSSLAVLQRSVGMCRSDVGILSTITKLGTKWKDIITSSADPSAVLDIPSWASRATLDAIGEGKFNFCALRKIFSTWYLPAAFDCEFGVMDNADNDLGKAYSNLLCVLSVLCFSAFSLGCFAG